MHRYEVRVRGETVALLDETTMQNVRAAARRDARTWKAFRRNILRSAGKAMWLWIGMSCAAALLEATMIPLSATPPVWPWSVHLSLAGALDILHDAIRIGGFLLALAVMIEPGLLGYRCAFRDALHARVLTDLGLDGQLDLEIRCVSAAAPRADP
mgnify:CR=1 FL=1